MPKKTYSFLFPNEFLTVEGQIIKLLLEGERMAGEIYDFVHASQSTISRKIARMVDQGMLDCRISPVDRRVPIYSISEKYRRSLQDTTVRDPTFQYEQPTYSN
jgi:DNA-binding MarR family transcriptional regulator